MNTSTATLSNSTPLPRAWWGGVFAMSLCAFALIASEFMPVSLLTPIAGDLRVSEGQAGWGIGISGVFAVLTSILLPGWLGHVNRKHVLLGMAALMGISGTIIASAPNYAIYMLGRALIGVVVGGFWSMSASVAMRLVPAAQVPRALAIFNGGNALATVLAAPLGSYLGGLMGWRGVFWALLPLALAVLAWLAWSLPALPPQKTAGRNTSIFRLFFSRSIVTVGMLACGLFFMGQFTLFTYVRPFLESITLVQNAETLSMILLTIGVAGIVGNALIGRLVARNLYGTIGWIPIGMALLAAGLMLGGAFLPLTWMLLGLWGLMATAAPVGWWSWLAKTLPDDAEAGGALMVAIIQFSIGFGSIAGGALWDQFSGPRATFSLAGMLLLSCAGLVFVTARKEKT